MGNIMKTISENKKYDCYNCNIYGFALENPDAYTMRNCSGYCSDPECDENKEYHDGEESCDGEWVYDVFAQRSEHIECKICDGRGKIDLKIQAKADKFKTHEIKCKGYLPRSKSTLWDYTTRSIR